MAKTKRLKTEQEPLRGRPALTPEARESQMISLAVNLAEEQLINGTASSQVITHYLKLGTIKNQLELEKLRHENEMIKAKTKALQSSEHIEELYTNAIAAMRVYGGVSNSVEDEENEDY